MGGPYATGMYWNYTIVSVSSTDAAVLSFVHFTLHVIAIVTSEREMITQIPNINDLVVK